MGRERTWRATVMAKGDCYVIDRVKTCLRLDNFEIDTTSIPEKQMVEIKVYSVREENN